MIIIRPFANDILPPRGFAETLREIYRVRIGEHYDDKLVGNDNAKHHNQMLAKRIIGACRLCGVEYEETEANIREGI